MTNRAIAALATLFVALFIVLAVRQAYVMIVKGPEIAAKPYNPRHALLGQRRGRILATDGTVLAKTVGRKRVYPFGASLAHTLGYVSPRYGTSGIEDAYDRALTPPDTTGDPQAQLADVIAALRGKTSAPRGADVVTTIVPAIQETAWQQLRVHARGAVVALDPRSGAILAMASVPSFDPNAIDAEFSSLNNDAASPLLDRAIDGLYPPGSTFKIFTAGSALESGTVTMDSHFEDPGYLVVGDFTLHDNEGEATGYQDLTTAFALSSNVDFAQIALKMGNDLFYQYLAKWGIGQSLDFQLPAETDRVPDKSSIVPGELAQMGFGQGALLMTPLQMALLAATIANDGNMPRPYVVRQIVRDGRAASVMPAGSLASPISADTAANVKKMMIAVVQRGTATNVSVPGVQVAGKTGTATNPHGAAHSWFVCFAPADHPRVAVAVIVENAGYGADVAAPIAQAVLRTALTTVKD
ncbi:MAG TPA: penicillin-binding transpeptidase domain-containing protein [Candidatus Aquilonibacter sp.]|nr:penicillin-binding transpeptidase domain-containing protein [Candidatus Aquilonibacter sp.]